MSKTRSAVCLAAVVLSGCAAPSSGSPGLTDSPGLSDSASSSGSPAVPATSAASLPAISAPPREPTDRIKNTKWVVGTVTTGGSGPCYSLMTDDGTAYALHAADGTKLVKGTRMRIKTETALVRIHCGRGKLVEMTAAEPLG
jgi:hypothetical protein